MILRVFSKVLLCLCLLWLTLAISAQSAERASAPSGDYKIHLGDKLSVRFTYQPELNDPALVVRPDGFISLQLIDDLKVDGLTVPQLKSRLEKAYEEILVKPQISISLIEYVAPRIYVGGQVAKPGRYDLRDGQTLIQAIFLAGGFTSEANKKMVVYARRDESGKWQIQSANVMSLLGKKSDKKEIPAEVTLADGDYVFVPESKLSQFNKIVERFTNILPRVY